MASHRPGGHTGVRTQLKFARQHIVHAVLVHDEHDKINGLRSDLETEAAARNGEERRSAPALRRTATGNAPPIACPHHKTTFNHGRHYGDTLGRAQHFFGNALVRRCLDLIQDIGSVFDPVFGFGLVFTVIRSPSRATNKDDDPQNSELLHEISPKRQKIWKIGCT